jgi:DNA-binding transcriptional MocR family regulator
MTSASDHELAAFLGAWRAKGGGPLAGQLGARLTRLVDDGLLSAGTRLPTERGLAGALGVSRSTVTAAYRDARDAGRLDSRQGSGTWVRQGPRRPQDRTGRHPARSAGAGPFDTLGRSDADVIDLSLAETRCDQHTRALLADVLATAPHWPVDVATGTGYHPQGLPDLRDLVAAYLRSARTGERPVHADDVLVTTGAQQAISLCATALAAPGSTVLVEEASYPGALAAFRQAGLRALPVPTDGRGPLPDALADLVARTRPALCYLIPVGNNPTGVVTPAERLDRLADVLARNGVTVVEDRTAAPLADPATVPAPLSARLPAGGVVTVGSMSKVAWAGLRIGWAAAAPHLLRELLAARLAADLAGSLVSQWLAARLMPHLERLAGAVRADVAGTQRALATALAAELPDWRGPAPQAGAWRWVQVPGDARLVARAARAEGVVVSSGPEFSAQGTLTDRLRLAAVMPPDVVAEGARRLRRAWEPLAGSTSVRRPDAGRDLLLI